MRRLAVARVVCVSGVVAAVVFAASVARAQPVINLDFSITNVPCFGGNNGQISVTPTGGAAPYTYSWSPAGGTGSTASSLVAGNYTVTVTDANSVQVTSQPQTVTQPSSPIFVSKNQMNVACNGDASGSATATVTGGTFPYTYAWSPSGGTGATAVGLTAGSYTVTVTDTNACTATQSYTIAQPPAITTSEVSQTNVACNGGATGAATITASGGEGTFSYDWSPGTPTGDGTASVAGLTAGTYTVTVTDANSCMASRQVIIIEAPAIVVTPTQSNVSCNGGSNGVASVSASGGEGPFTYAWSPSGGSNATAAGLAPGAYSVTITDANSCTKTSAFTITQPTALVATTLSQTNVSCHGGSNGVASASVSGGTPGYTYSWSPAGGTGAAATGLTAGTYTLTVTDANACTTTHGVTLTEPSALVATPSHTDIDCHGAQTGTAGVLAAGGTSPYTYQWSSGQTTSSITDIAAGTYGVTVTDTNSCTAQSSIVVTEPATPFTADVVSVTNVSCSGGSDGGATVQASGGTPDYTYAWSPSGGTTTTLAGEAAGTYTITITDGKGCTASNNVAVSEPDPLVVTLASSTPNGCGDAPSGSLGISVSGGNGGYTYDWTPDATGDGTSSISGLVQGSYSVAVDDALGCTTSSDFDVVLADNAVPVTRGANLLVARGSGTSITLSVTYNGCTPLDYQIVTPPAHGTLDGTAPALTYHADPDYIGPDGFSFQVAAGNNVSAIADVAITVFAASDDTQPPATAVQFPVANALEVSTTVGQPVAFTLSGSDPNGAPITYTLLTQPSSGRLTGTAPLLTYIPTVTGAYDDQFTFVVRNSDWLSAPATVTIHVGEAASATTGSAASAAGCAATAPGELTILAIALLLARRYRLARSTASV